MFPNLTKRRFRIGETVAPKRLPECPFSTPTPHRGINQRRRYSPKFGEYLASIILRNGVSSGSCRCPAILEKSRATHDLSGCC